MFTRPVRLMALTLSAGVALAATAAGANAATSPAFSYQGTTTSDGLTVALSLPASIGSALPALPAPLNLNLSQPITIGLVHSAGQFSHDATHSAIDLANSQSQFVTGSLADALKNLGLNLESLVTSSLSNPGPNHAAGVLGLPANINVPGLTNLALPNLSVASLSAPLQTLMGSSGINLSLLKLSDLVPAADLNALISQLQGLVAPGGTLSSALGGILGQLGSPLAGTPLGNLAAALSGLQTQLTSLQGTLANQIGSLENGALLSLNGLSASHLLNTVAGQEVSTTGVKLASLNLLSGLVTLDGFANNLTTYAGGTAGSGKVVAQPNLAQVKVAGVLSALLGPNGLSLDTSGLTSALNALGAGALSTAVQTLVSQLNSGLATLTNTLNSLLNVAGVSITPDKVVSQDVAADGSHASAALSGLEIRVAQPLSSLPTGLGSASRRALADTTSAPRLAQSAALTEAPLLDVKIGSVSASSDALINAVPAVHGTTSGSKPSMAFTGADLPLTGSVALLLIGAGVYMARRRRPEQG